jgi:hypothetical protein
VIVHDALNAIPPRVRRLTFMMSRLLPRYLCCRDTFAGSGRHESRHVGLLSPSYGLRLSMIEFNRSYVATLEDDLQASAPHSRAPSRDALHTCTHAYIHTP